MKLLTALKFYNLQNPEDLLNSEDIIRASTFSFSISFIIMFLTLFNLDPLVSLIISTIFGLIIGRKIYNFLIVQYKIQFNTFLQYLDLVYQDLLIISKTSSSIFDSIQYISQSNYPIISNYFKSMIEKINLGADPKKLFLEFTDAIGVESFKEKVISILSFDFNRDFILNNDPEFSMELLSKYEHYTKQLETRLTIIITVNIFLPIITITLFSFYFSLNSLYFLILLPFHLSILYILKKSLLKKQIEILGARENNTFKDLITFLILLSNYLKLKNSPEISLIKSLYMLNRKLSPNTSLIINDLFNRGNDLEDIWKNLIVKFERNKQSITLLNLIFKMLRKDSVETGFRLKNVIENILQNKKLIEKRRILIKSMQFKVFLLLGTLTCLIGLITNIIPLMGSFFQVLINSNFIDHLYINDSYLFFIPILISISIIIFFVSYTILNIVEIKKSKFYSISFVIIYLLVYYVTDIIFNFGFII
jgi:hypothetical protein